MIALTIGIWLFVALAFDPRLFRLLDEIPGAPGKGFVAVLIACLNYFWLLAAYHVALMLFAGVCRLTPRYRRRPWTGPEPEVAILYTTMNDFQERAALSCVQQEYTRFHVYILDDSLDVDERHKIDAFARVHSDRVTVVRRSDRRGYKAGSLNHALLGAASRAPFFAVADADSVLPPHFIRSLLPPLMADPSLGWVQASHRPHPHQHSAFARDLASGIIPLWTVFFEPKNRFGFVMFLGHGGLIRYSAWQNASGFPEVVAEDLCLSTRMARLGYRGLFVPDVICFEDFPEGYRQLRRQQEKYIKGACQFFHHECLDFLRSPAVPWHEKLDVVVPCLSLFAPVVNFAFLLTYCICIPVALGEWRLLTVGFAGRVLSFTVLTQGQPFFALWTSSFYVLTLACMVAPALGSVALAVKHPRRGLRTLLLSPAPYLSLMVAAVGAVISYATTRQAAFLVTADRAGAVPGGWPRGFSPSARLAERLGSEDRFTHAVELLAGSFLLLMCVITANIALFGLALAIGLGPILLKARWDGLLVRSLVYSPSLIICFGMAVANPAAMAGQGALMNVFMFHF